MNAPASMQLIHIGPLRQESEALLKHIALPSLVITPRPESPTLKGIQSDLKYVSAVVAPQAEEATRYSYNVPGFDSLAPASGLKSLYPGVAETQRKPVETQPLNELISEHCPSGTFMTHLVLEQPEQALSLLQAWQEEGILDDLEGLFVRTSPISLYEGMPTQAELIAWCQQYGFDTGAEKIDPDSSEDPEFILLEFKRNALHLPLKVAQEEADALKQECDSLKKKLSEYEKLLKENANQLTEAAAALRETDTQLKERTKQHDEKAIQAESVSKECATLKQQFSEVDEALRETRVQLEKLTKQCDEKTLQAENASKECAALKQQLSEKESTITQLREQLASQQQNQTVIQSRFEALESKMEGKLESLLREQRSYIQQTSNALGQHVTRLAHKQRDERALIHYLHHGQKPVSTELDPGYALALLEQYHSQGYDVVVVFGSAATTELLAKAEVSSHGNQSQLMLEGQPNEAVAPSENDLPTSIISIEHQRSQCAAIIKSLEANNCRQAVNIVHAPLIEYESQGQTTLFYNAETTLKQLGQWLPDNSRVLVIIGPILEKVNNGIYSGLSQLLQHLPSPVLEILIENLDFALENELKKDWSFLLNKWQRKAKWYYLPGALGLEVTD
ncbi:hypothetical protein [Vreelandella titanicae]|uniref:hypothetical protein n=1 Tax=Vreelandella titanicae TaxID=664683 RepID=UPI0015934188|nr:hypothetical protein [Halomonas titanicae]NVE92089.1 hypothetical protein [Halomonas titanicae]